MAEDMTHNNSNQYWDDHNAKATTGVILGSIGTGGFILNWLKDLFTRNNIPVGAGCLERLATQFAPVVERMAVSGCGTAQDAALLAKIASLESERYTDNKIQSEIEKNNATNVANLKDFYAQFIAVRDDAATTKAELKCLNEKLTTYEITQREKSALEKENADLKLGLVKKDIDCLADKVKIGFETVSNRFAGVDAVLAGITKTVVPGSVVCGKTCGDCCSTNAQQ